MDQGPPNSTCVKTSKHGDLAFPIPKARTLIWDCAYARFFTSLTLEKVMPSARSLV